MNSVGTVQKNKVNESGQIDSLGLNGHSSLILSLWDLKWHVADTEMVTSVFVYVFYCMGTQQLTTDFGSD